MNRLTDEEKNEKKRKTKTKPTEEAWNVSWKLNKDLGYAKIGLFCERDGKMVLLLLLVLGERGTYKLGRI